MVNSFPKISETFIFNKVLGLIDSDVNITVLAYYISNDLAYFKNKIKGKNLQIKIVPIARLNPFQIGITFLFHLNIVFNVFFKVRSSCTSFRQIIKKILLLIPVLAEPFDIIHFEFSGLGIQYLELLDLISSKKIISCRGSAEQLKPLYNNQRKMELTSILTKVDLIHCVSKAMQDTLIKYGLDVEKSFINPPAVDTDFFKRSKPYFVKKKITPIKIVSIGRLHWKKGFNYAFHAIKILKEQNYNITYEIIGQGIELESLSFLKNILSLNDCVSLQGALPSSKIKEALEEADIFLLPSLSEGISNAALEAMSMEIPIVSSKAGGMSEAIEDGINGRLVDVTNVRQMAAILKWMILNPLQRIKLGKAGRETVITKFTLKNQVQNFLIQYNNLLK